MKCVNRTQLNFDGHDYACVRRHNTLHVKASRATASDIQIDASPTPTSWDANPGYLDTITIFGQHGFPQMLACKFLFKVSNAARVARWGLCTEALRTSMPPHLCQRLGSCFESIIREGSGFLWGGAG